MHSRNANFQIRVAVEADAEAVASCVTCAYEHYVARIGRPPGPMGQDYRQVIRECDVFVVPAEQDVLGVLVLKRTDEGFLLDNIAVSPKAQGKRIGRALLALAERQARLAGYDSIYLYTHVMMSENRELYSRIGYVEYDQRTDEGLQRVYMRKRLEV